MKTCRSLSLILSFLLAITAAALGLPGTAQSAPGFVLSQESVDTGPYQMKVSPLGVRLDGRELTIIINADSQASLYNRKTKMYCQGTDKKLMAEYGAPPLVSTLKPGGTMTLNNHQCKQWYGQAYDQKTHKPLWVLEIFTTRDFRLPQRVEDDCSEMMGLPPGYGWPFKVVHYYNYGTPQQQQKVCLITHNVKPINTSADDFLPLYGYQLVKSEAQVLTGATDKDMDDILKELEKSSPNKHR